MGEPDAREQQDGTDEDREVANRERGATRDAVQATSRAASGSTTSTQAAVRRTDAAPSVSCPTTAASPPRTFTMVASPAPVASASASGTGSPPRIPAIGPKTSPTLGRRDHGAPVCSAWKYSDGIQGA